MSRGHLNIDAQIIFSGVAVLVLLVVWQLNIVVVLLPGYRLTDGNRMGYGKNLDLNCTEKNSGVLESEQVPISSQLASNFSRIGVAIKEPGGYNGQNLYILYEEPGKPALRAQLLFDENSLCGDENNKIVCMALSVSDYGLSNGRKIKVQGIETEGNVAVRQLTLFP